MPHCLWGSGVFGFATLQNWDNSLLLFARTHSHHLLAGTEASNGKGPADTRQMLRERRPTAELRLNLAYDSHVAPQARSALMPDLLSQIEAESALSDLGGDEYTASLDAAAMRGRIPHLDAHLTRIGEEFRHQLAELRPQVVRRGASLLGPHRDDLLFKLGDLALGAYGSRGQQRTAVLALKPVSYTHLTLPTT